MTRETLILVGRTETTAVARQHAARLRARETADDVVVMTYDEEPARELKTPLSACEDERSYVVPLCFAHTHGTITDVPRALERLDGDVRYCDPIGTSPIVTQAIRDRAAAASDADALLLVALGNSSESHAREAATRHAERLESSFEEVKTAYLLQSPAVECARYTLAADHAVVCPLFIADCAATTEQIPSRLELGRGGLDYAAPFGDSEVVTEAIRVAVRRERVLAESNARTAGNDLLAAARPVATDGRGDERDGA